MGLRDGQKIDIFGVPGGYDFNFHCIVKLKLMEITVFISIIFQKSSNLLLWTIGAGHSLALLIVAGCKLNFFSLCE